MTKCPCCKKELQQLEGTYKVAVQIGDDTEVYVSGKHSD